MNPIRPIKEWLQTQWVFQWSGLANNTDKLSDSQAELTELTGDTAEKLMAAVDQLPVHPQQQSAVLTAVRDAIAQWRNAPKTAPNSIVVLGSPVSSVSRLLTESLPHPKKDAKSQDKAEPQSSLDDWSMENVHLLDWDERPADIRTIQQQIHNTLGLSQFASAPDHGTDGEKPTQRESAVQAAKHLMVIPNLCWCFLRSAEGLDGLDALQDWIPQDSDRFWLLGSGKVGWEYLNATLMFAAYCGSAMALPKLTGDDLAHWLQPIIEKFDISFGDAALPQSLQNSQQLADSLTDGVALANDYPLEAVSRVVQDVSTVADAVLDTVTDELAPQDETEDADDSAWQGYFERLAQVSEGVGSIALQLFINSLRCQGESDHRLVATLPKRPTLPDLQQDDLYLLYSLLLHGGMPLLALSQSLGDSPQRVNSQVQLLRKAGVIEQWGNTLQVNTAHYPTLYRELARNNFMIDVP